MSKTAILYKDTHILRGLTTETPEPGKHYLPEKHVLLTLPETFVLPNTQLFLRRPDGTIKSDMPATEEQVKTPGIGLFAREEDGTFRPATPTEKSRRGGAHWVLNEDFSCREATDAEIDACGCDEAREARKRQDRRQAAKDALLAASSEKATIEDVRAALGLLAATL